MDVIKTGERPRFETLDGSLVREFAHPSSSVARTQSLAEAEVPGGGSTAEHFHRSSEEIYYFTGGAGVVRIGDQEADVGPGDLVVIPPGVRHKLWAAAGRPLTLLCCCSPPYSDEDTVLTGD